MSRKIITQSITNKEFTDKFINFSEIALWSYTLNDNFIKGDDFLKFIDCIFNSQLTYANEAYLKFVNIKSFDLIKNKNILESSNFTHNTIEKFYHDLYLNDFRIKKYTLEEEIEDHYKSIECNIFCEFNSESKLIRVNGSFIDRSNDFKAKRDLEKLNNILVDQNSYFSHKIEKQPNYLQVNFIINQ